MNHLRAPDGTVLCEQEDHDHGPDQHEHRSHHHEHGRRLSSPALVADGQHARVDGFVSLGVLASAAAVSLGLKLADPIIGLVITAVILRITWESWLAVSRNEPGELLDG